VRVQDVTRVRIWAQALSADGRSIVSTSWSPSLDPRRESETGERASRPDLQADVTSPFERRLSAPNRVPGLETPKCLANLRRRYIKLWHVRVDLHGTRTSIYPIYTTPCTSAIVRTGLSLTANMPVRACTCWMLLPRTMQSPMHTASTAQTAPDPRHAHQAHSVLRLLTPGTVLRTL
jgi:hypothetical protein